MKMRTSAVGSPCENQTIENNALNWTHFPPNTDQLRMNKIHDRLNLQCRWLCHSIRRKLPIDRIVTNNAVKPRQAKRGEQIHQSIKTYYYYCHPIAIARHSRSEHRKNATTQYALVGTAHSFIKCFIFRIYRLFFNIPTCLPRALHCLSLSQTARSRFNALQTIFSSFACVLVMVRRAKRIVFYCWYVCSTDDLSSFASIIVTCVRFNIFVV